MKAYGVIEVPKITGIGIMKHRIRIDICQKFPVEDIIDPKFVQKIISYLQRNNLIADYDRIDLVLSKNDRRLKATKNVIGYIGRFKVRRNQIERYNLYVIKK